MTQVTSHGFERYQAAKFPLELPARICIVASVKRFRAITTPVFIVCWLVVFILGGLTLQPTLNLLPDTDTAQTTAPADNDDHSEDSTPTTDCALPDHRIEISVSAPLVLRLDSGIFNLTAGRTALDQPLPRNWQFLQRAAAAPRAPARLG